MNKAEIDSDPEKRLVVTMGQVLRWGDEIGEADEEAQNLSYDINQPQG